MCFHSTKVLEVTLNMLVLYLTVVIVLVPDILAICHFKIRHDN